MVAVKPPKSELRRDPAAMGIIRGSNFIPDEYICHLGGLWGFDGGIHISARLMQARSSHQA